MDRWPLCLLIALTSGACDGRIYVRDGVTDGDTFYLAERALHDPDPVLQSWVSYSLTRSACQLQIGGQNPARATSFECELTAREHLLETWKEHRAENPALTDGYLDELLRVRDAGYLDEYILRHFRKKSWHEPPGIDRENFESWQKRHLRRHKPETRIIGSWNYAHKVRRQGNSY
ncbi:MAG: hypothetical protein ACREQ8_07635 [Woeseiaceae bacterium]